jgi:hypothetical protein
MLQVRDAARQGEPPALPLEFLLLIYVSRLCGPSGRKRRGNGNRLGPVASMGSVTRTKAAYMQVGSGARVLT